MAQAGQCSCRTAEIGTSGRDRGDAGDLQRRGHRHAQVAIKAFEIDYAAKYPKVVAKIVDDADVLLEVLQVSGRALDPSAHDKSDRYLEWFLDSCV